MDEEDRKVLRDAWRIKNPERMDEEDRKVLRDAWANCEDAVERLRVAEKRLEDARDKLSSDMARLRRHARSLKDGQESIRTLEVFVSRLNEKIKVTQSEQYELSPESLNSVARMVQFPKAHH